MNKTTTKSSTSEGWSVHIYDGDRRLRFTLEPSHIWAFSWGIGVGLLLSIAWSALNSADHSFSSDTNHSENSLPTPETSSRETLQAEPTSSFPFGID